MLEQKDKQTKVQSVGAHLTFYTRKFRSSKILCDFLLFTKNPVAIFLHKLFIFAYILNVVVKKPQDIKRSKLKASVSFKTELIVNVIKQKFELIQDGCPSIVE